MFKKLGRKEMRILLGNMEHHAYTQNSEVIKEGKSGKYFFIVITGTLDYYSNGQKGQKPLQEGDTFGEKALINGSQRTATVIC
jgi:CRP-like cAMP-binding protein